MKKIEDVLNYICKKIDESTNNGEIFLVEKRFHNVEIELEKAKAFNLIAKFILENKNDEVIHELLP